MSKKSANHEAFGEIDDQTIPEEERNAILQWIDEDISRSRSRIDPDRFILPKKRKDLWLPLLVNGLSIVLIVAGVVFFLLFYKSEAEGIVEEDSAGLRVRNEIFQIYKKEGEQKLQEKEQQIQTFRDQLLQVNNERDTLKLESEAKLAARERELREELAEERKGLEDQLKREGETPASIQRRLNELEAQNNQKLAQAMLEYQSELSDELLSRQEDLAAREEAYKSSLAAAEAEVLVIRGSAESRLADASEKQKALEQELKILSDGRANTQAMLSSLESAVAAAARYYQVGDYSRAAEALERETVAQDPAGLAIVESLQSMMTASEQSQRRIAAEAAQNATNALVRELTALGDRGDARAREGKVDDALLAYNAVIDRFPATRAAHDYILAATTAEQQATHAAALSSQRSELLARTADYTSSLRTLEADLQKEKELAGQYRDSDVEAQAALSALRAGVTSLQASLEAMRTTAVEEQASYETDLLKMLQAKLTFKKILDRDDIAAEFPELATYLDKYYESVAMESRITASLALIQQIAEKTAEMAITPSTR